MEEGDSRASVGRLSLTVMVSTLAGSTMARSEPESHMSVLCPGTVEGQQMKGPLGLYTDIKDNKEGNAVGNGKEYVRRHTVC